jgi:tetratricopeptide (TPR) repeat protein
MAHQTYGLAVATADLTAVQEALFYLYTLYILRNADYALAIPRLADAYFDLATEIHGDQIPDLEARHAKGRDLLKSPRTIDTAVEFAEMAKAQERQGELGAACYLYQVAAIFALWAEDGDELKRKWITATVCGDWAKTQASANQLVWGAANYQFAIALFRELVVADPFRYSPALAMCLNNFGALEYGRRNWSAAEGAYVEALQIRRGFTNDSREDPAMLCSSLANLALVRSELEKFDSASTLYREALDVCENRLRREPEAVIDLTWLQASFSLCLARTPEGKSEAQQLAKRASANLDAVAAINDARAVALAGLIRNAMQASSGT